MRRSCGARCLRRAASTRPPAAVHCTVCGERPETNIYAVGAGGTHPALRWISWSAMSSPTRARLSRISGSGANDVWAAGDTVLLHFDGQHVEIGHFPGGGGGDISGSISRRRATSRRASGPRARASCITEPGMAEFSGAAGRTGARTRSCFRGWLRSWEFPVLAADARWRSQTPGGSPTADAPNLLRGVGPTGCLSAPMTAPSSWP